MSAVYLHRGDLTISSGAFMKIDGYLRVEDTILVTFIVLMRTLLEDSL